MLNNNAPEQTVANQVLHKIEFIDTQLQGFKNIILAGHSVGSYLITEIMRESSPCKSKSKIKKAFLLTPTISHFRDSYNGTNYLPELNRTLNRNATTMDIIGKLYCIQYFVIAIVCMVKYCSCKLWNSESHVHHWHGLRKNKHAYRFCLFREEISIKTKGWFYSV